MQYLTKLNALLGVTAVALVVMLILQNNANKALQSESQQQVLEIRSGQQTQQVTGQVAANIIRDLAQLSIANENLRDLLAKHGFQVTLNNQPQSR